MQVKAERHTSLYVCGDFGHQFHVELPATVTQHYNGGLNRTGRFYFDPERETTEPAGFSQVAGDTEQRTKSIFGAGIFRGKIF